LIIWTSGSSKLQSKASITGIWLFLLWSSDYQIQ
jgi:hypothetical protein